MSDQPNWAPESDRYRRSKGVPASGETLLPPHSSQTDEDRWRFEDTGLTWGPFDVDKIRSSSIERSRHRFRAHLPELIWNTAALEGNNFTLPEVKTLLEGVTVGGKRLEDEQQIIALSEAYNRLDEIVGLGRFSLTKDVADELHRLVARHEAIASWASAKRWFCSAKIAKAMRGLMLLGSAPAAFSYQARAFSGWRRLLY